MYKIKIGIKVMETMQVEVLSYIMGVHIHFSLGFIRPSFIHLLTDDWVVFIHLAK